MNPNPRCPSPPERRSARRGFLRGAALAVPATAGAALLPVPPAAAPAPSALPADAAPAASGYRLSEHVATYYRRARY